MKSILNIKNIFLYLIIVFISFACGAKTLQSTKTDSTTGAKTWETHVHGVTFSLTQILPDQVRAFYVNRGFTLDQIEPFATSCVYMAVLRNDSAATSIHFVRGNWSILNAGKSQPPKKVSDWIQQLKNKNTTKPALIAFRWAQFPPEQSYEPGGDWNQGMFSIGLPPGSQSDVIARWDMREKPYEAKLQGVLCAE